MRKGWVWAGAVFAAASMLGCSGPGAACEDCDAGAGGQDAGGQDAASSFDAGEIDAGGGGADAGQDAGGARDAGRDGGAARDAGRDGGPECTTVPHAGCPEGQACRVYAYVMTSEGAWRRERVAPHCEPAGPRPEHWSGGSCVTMEQDFCQAGLFCSPVVTDGCVRYCDPSGEPCPAFWNTTLARYQEQRCESFGGAPPHCRIN